jgi:hypothetical protein
MAALRSATSRADRLSAFAKFTLLPLEVPVGTMRDDALAPIASLRASIC